MITWACRSEKTTCVWNAGQTIIIVADSPGSAWQPPYSRETWCSGFPRATWGKPREFGLTNGCQTVTAFPPLERSYFGICKLPWFVGPKARGSILCWRLASNAKLSPGLSVAPSPLLSLTLLVCQTFVMQGTNKQSICYIECCYIVLAVTLCSCWYAFLTSFIIINSATTTLFSV